MESLILSYFCLFLVTGVHSKVTFDGVQTYLDLSGTHPSFRGTQIKHIVPNLFQQGSFIVGTETTLFTARFWPESQKEFDVIVGSENGNLGYREGRGTEVRFKSISGLVQVGNRYIVSDKGNHCLRSVEPPQQAWGTIWTTKTFAGRCTVSGLSDGNKLDVRFNEPYGIINQGDVLFITEFGGRKLRRLDMNTGMTTTIHTSGTFQLQGLVFSHATNEFFVTVRHGILRIQDEKESWLVGWLEETNQKTDERFSSAGFAEPEAIIWLDTKRLLVSDYKSSTVKVVDVDAEEVDVLCKGGDTESSDIRQCALNKPSSFLVLNQGNEILVGETGGIRKINYNYVGEQAPEIITEPSETTTAVDFGVCNPPDMVSSASYMALGHYPTGTVVRYECDEGYVKPEGSSNVITCVHAKQEYFWFGDEVKCQPSSSMIAMIALAVICAVLLGVLIVVVMNLVKSQRRLRMINQQSMNPIMSPRTTLESDVSELSDTSVKRPISYGNDDNYCEIRDNGDTLNPSGYVNARVSVPSDNPYLSMNDCRTGLPARAPPNIQ